MFEWSSEHDWLQTANNGGCVSLDNVVPTGVGNEDHILLSNFFEKEVGNDATPVKNDTHTCNVEYDFFSYLSTMEDPFPAGLGSSSWNNFSPLVASGTSAEFIGEDVHQLGNDSVNLCLDQEENVFREYEWDNIESFYGFDNVFRNKPNSPAKSLILPDGSSTSWESPMNSTEEFFPLEKEPMKNEENQSFTLHSINQLHEQQNLPDSEFSDIHRGGSNLCTYFLSFQNTKDDPLNSRTTEWLSDGHRNSEDEKSASVNPFPTTTAAGKVENYSNSVITESSHQISSASIADFPSGGDYSDPEGIVLQFQQVVAKLDPNSRLLLRDCLFRLGRNAAERHDTSTTEATSAVKYIPCDCNGFDKDDNRCVMGGGGNHEMDTNSIDRLVVHLLFIKPPPTSSLHPTTTTTTM